jgi:cytochrome c553
VPRGTVKTLRAVALDFRAAGVGSNGNGGPGGGAMISTPVSIGNGAWDPKIILGDATVYEDGSTFFRVPARTPIYFQLLDEKGRMVQTMRSWSTLQPGENGACVGCHEDKNQTPASHLPITLAVQAGVETLKPFYGPPRGFSFLGEVQPMLDAKCASCHNGEKKEKEVPYDLSAREVEDIGAKRKWTQAYLALTHAWPDDKENNAGWRGRDGDPMVNWVSAQSAPPMQPPLSVGSNRSRLMELLDKGHEKVSLSREELDKLAAWIDLSVPFCGDYTEANTWTPEEIEKYQRYAAKRRTLAEEDQSNISQWLQSNPALRP